MNELYVVAKIFDQQGCLAYKCKTANEARSLPGILEALRLDGVQIVVLDSPDLYEEYAPYAYEHNLKNFIDRVYEMKRKREQVTSKCLFCKREMVEQKAAYMAELGDSIVVVKKVPTLVCQQCGAKVYTDEVAATLENIVAKAKEMDAEITVLNFPEL